MRQKNLMHLVGAFLKRVNTSENIVKWGRKNL